MRNVVNLTNPINQLNTSDRKSGVYIVRVLVGDEVLTETMTVKE